MKEKIYVMYDDDGDIFCAFDNEDKARLESEDTGARYTAIILYKK